MTERHSRYENYPPTTAESHPSALGEPPPTDRLPGEMTTPTFGRVQPQPASPSRRLLLGGLAGVAVLSVPIIFGLSQGSDGSASVSEEADAPMPPDDLDLYDLNGFEVSVPIGWTEVSSTDHRLVIRQDGNTVTFLHYAAGQDASAADEAVQQLRRYAADVRKATTQRTTSDTIDQFEKAEAVLTGELNGKPVKGRAEVVIDVDDNDYDAAAVVSVVLTTAPKDVRAEVDRMSRDFLDQLG